MYNLILLFFNPECAKGRFECGSGNCIPARLKCNGHKDCDDGSDEQKECGEYSE